MKECEEGVLKLTEGLEVEVKALEGEEETEFLEKAQSSINDRRARGGKNNQRGRRGGGRGGGGRGGGRGYRGETTFLIFYFNPSTPNVLCATRCNSSRLQVFTFTHPQFLTSSIF